MASKWGVTMKQSSLGLIWKQIVFSAILGLVALVGLLLITGYWRSMELYEKRIINGDIHDVWRVATDVGRWPDWDPHEEAGEIYGPFEVGTKAYSKPRGGPGAHWSLTVVNEGNSWSLINPMWLGTLNVENRYTKLTGGQVLCEKTMHVSG